MDALVEINGMATAFVAGLITSVHCVAMCGPLACLLLPRRDSSASYLQVTAVYHSCRILSYGLVGALAGGLGLLTAAWVSQYQVSLLRFFPWALVLFFVLMATRLDKRLPKPRWLSLWTIRAANRCQKLPALGGGAAVGLLTPLLPCGPLYFVFALALMTQSPVRGAEFLVAFGLGTLPLLWVAQAQLGVLQRKLSPQMMDYIQRGIATVAAIAIGYRLYVAETGEGGFFCSLM